jgi:hypothetical protein
MSQSHRERHYQLEAQAREGKQEHLSGSQRRDNGKKKHDAKDAGAQGQQRPADKDAVIAELQRKLEALTKGSAQA